MTAAPADPAPPARPRRWRAVLVVAAIGALVLLASLGAFAWRTWSRPPALVKAVPPGWQEVDAGGRFSFRAPPDLQPEPVQGTDSFVGRYRGDSLDLGFDYGMFSNPLDEEDEPDFLARRVTVSGFAARLVEYRNPASAYPFVTAIHFPDLGDGLTRLTVSASGKSLEDRHDALTLFASLRIRPARR